MRLDKYLADSGRYTRSEASRVIRRGSVSVNGAVVKDPSLKIDEATAVVTAEGEAVGYQRFRYFMLNKPSDTVSTTEDDPKSVMKLLPLPMQRMDLFPCGRLDIDTVGLLILTNDGAAAHALLSPKKHCEKTYRFTCRPIGEAERLRLENGVPLSDFTSKPCKVRLDDSEHGEITVTEGKYHQVKRMFLAVGSEILSLERIAFGGLTLDPALARGEWRELTDEETERLLAQTKS